MSASAMLFLMLAGHALCDYPLQGDWLSKAKNHKLSLVPGEIIWPMALASHASMHAAMVYLVTGWWVVGALEFIAHTAIDYAKCDGRISYNQDQLLHIICKVLWIGLIVSFRGAL